MDDTKNSSSRDEQQQRQEITLAVGGGGSGGRGLMDYPEVQMLVVELNNRLTNLESIIENNTNNDEQAKEALIDVSSNIRGLIHCLNHRHLKQQEKVLLALCDDDDEADEKGGDDNDDDTKKVKNTLSSPRNNILQLAKTKSKKQLLSQYLEDYHNNHQGGIRRASADTYPLLPQSPLAAITRRTASAGEFHSNNRRKSSLLLSELPSIIPREILGMMESDSSESVFSAAIAHEYGGLELPSRYIVKSGSTTTDGTKQRRSMKQFAKAISKANVFVDHAKVMGNVGKNELEYIPSEFTRLGLNGRKRLAQLLSWENLKSWEFNTFEIDRLSTIRVFRGASDRSLLGQNNNDMKQRRASDATKESLHDSSNSLVESSEHGCPIVLVGWAILASPYSQLAMAKNVEDEELIEIAYNAIKQRANTAKGEMAKQFIEGIVDGESSKEDGEPAKTVKKTDAWNGGYFLLDEFAIAPKAICRVLRKAEKEYSRRSVIPYHNNIHSADVVQSTHALIQMGGQDMEMAYTPLETYSILWAAVLHDIKHPGTSNNYQINKRTELALIYNDQSVLEQMHASRASLLLLESLEDEGSDVLGSMTDEQKKMFRSSLIRSILYTDMSRHFSEVAKMTRRVEALEDEIAGDDDCSGSGSSRSLLARIGSSNHEKFRTNFLPYILHMADISSPSKSHHVQLEWSEAVYDEFFLQGDKEAAEDMPISPLCDRNTTNRPEAQCGFINFVVKPGFLLLARCLPNIDIVLNQLEANCIYWEEEKAKAKEVKNSEEKAKTITMAKAYDGAKVITKEEGSSSPVNAAA